MTRPVPLTPALLRQWPIPRAGFGDKYDHGRLLVIAGSRDIVGSATITAHAAFHAGVGKVTVATVESAAPIVRQAVLEAMVVALPEGGDGGPGPAAVRDMAERAADYDAVVAGPGLRPSPATEAIAAKLCRAGKPVALDAAFLRNLPRLADDAREAAIAPVLLPNASEMAALIGCDEEEVEADPIGCGQAAAAHYGAVVLVKGINSHIVTPDGSAWRYEGGAPGLGVSGSGDALAGIVGALLARGAPALNALLWAVWLHGEAGRALAERIGPIGFLARKISAEVPPLLRRLDQAAGDGGSQPPFE